jgi:hypothetical protein
VFSRQDDRKIQGSGYGPRTRSQFG